MPGQFAYDGLHCPKCGGDGNEYPCRCPSKEPEMTKKKEVPVSHPVPATPAQDAAIEAAFAGMKTKPKTFYEVVINGDIKLTEDQTRIIYELLQNGVAAQAVVFSKSKGNQDALDLMKDMIVLENLFKPR